LQKIISKVVLGMVYKTRRCKIEGCGKGGAFYWNNLCTYHWDVLIEENIKKLVDELKKETK